MRIEINAHQWAWDARYAGPDGKFNTEDDIVTLNDIRVPVGAPVILQLASTDVIHSFYLPNFRVKQDAVPGHDQPHVVPRQGDGRVRDRLRPALRRQPLQDEGPCSPCCRADEYDAWASDSSRSGARGYDPKDTEAHWGWEWQARN